jgi:hypothetical protein
MNVSFDIGQKIKWIQLEPVKSGDFSLGILPKCNSKKKKLKSKKKIPIQTQTSVYNKKEVVIPKFEIYTGPKLFIPWKIQLTETEKNKFNLINIYNPNKKDFQSIFKKAMKDNTFTSYTSNFRLPAEIQLYFDKLAMANITEWNKIKHLFLKLFKLKNMVKKLTRLWLYKKCLKNLIDTKDIVTMENPKKPVYILNFERRCSYVYEANTIRKSINNRLLNSEYMFPMSVYPLNILSNEQLTYIQAVSVYNQLKIHGACSWAFERFKVCNFNLKRFEKRCGQQLKLSAIDNHFYNDNELIFETVFDYFTLMADHIHINEFYISAFREDFMKSKNYSNYIKEWIRLTHRVYINRLICDINEEAAITIESGKLLTRLYYIYSKD